MPKTRVLGVVISGALAIGPVARARRSSRRRALRALRLRRDEGQATLLLNDKTAAGGGAEPTEPATRRAGARACARGKRRVFST